MRPLSMRRLGALLAAAVVFGGPFGGLFGGQQASAAELKARSGKLDGYHWKWIFEGRRVVVCTNISEERGRELVEYLDWAFPTIAKVFDTKHRDRYQKVWQARFKKLIRGKRRRQDNGTLVWPLQHDGVEATGFLDQEGNMGVVLPADKQLEWHRRMHKKVVVHYVADQAEQQLVQNAYEPIRGEADGRSFFREDYGILLIDESLAFNLPFHVTLDTAVHEMSHYMFAYSSFVQPVWFNEGFASFLHVQSDRSVKQGTARFDFLVEMAEARKAKRFIRLAKLITYDNKHFRADPDVESLLYAEAWALFTFLSSPASGHRKAFQGWFNRMRRGDDPTAAFRSTFKVPKLEREWLKWCDFQLNRLQQKGHVKHFDFNQDGDADQWWLYKGGYHKVTKSDEDFDGRPDAWIVHNRDGTTKTSAWDESGDGKRDRYQDYEAGVLVRYRFDHNHDGKIDEIQHVDADNVRTSTQKDTDFDGTWDVDE